MAARRPGVAIGLRRLDSRSDRNAGGRRQARACRWGRRDHRTGL